MTQTQKGPVREALIAQSVCIREGHRLIETPDKMYLVCTACGSLVKPWFSQNGRE